MGGKNISGGDAWVLVLRRAGERSRGGVVHIHTRSKYTLPDGERRGLGWGSVDPASGGVFVEVGISGPGR